jgi:hypothetical protein
MTGKELLLVLAGTAAAAGAGGIGAAAIVADAPADTGPDTAVLEQLDKLQDSLDGTNRIMSESRDEIAGLKRRIDSVEHGLRGVKPARATSTGRARVDATRHAGAERTGHGEAGSGALTFSTSDDELQAVAGEQLKVALGKLKEQLSGGEGSPLIGSVMGADGEPLQVATLRGRLVGLQKGFELRRLPEEERWAKAREDVGLTNVQEDEIKSALAERDQAIEESMQIERDEENENGRISIRHMDFEKTRAANEAYRKRVDNTLNDEQKKSWRENGYDNAFGKGASGSATVISVGTFTTGGSSSSDDEK